jgi:uncharacterized protein YecE (DUF72 family)
MGVAQANQLQRDETESQIKKLEEAEMQMLSQMQATLKRKQEAMGKLETKSKALKRGIEPRNAYGKKKGSTQDVKEGDSQT